MKAVELFAGAGGLGIGLTQAGFSPMQIVERDRWCCDTIRRNRDFQDSVIKSWPAPTQGDVRKIDFRHLEGKISLVSGGPPCQPFSLGGKHRANEDHRDMWGEAVRAVREIGPSAFIFENVKGLTRTSFASYLQYIERQLNYPAIFRHAEENWEQHLVRLEQHHTGRKGDEERRYNVVYQVLNAADFGVAQRRERVVFVGFRADLDVRWAFPSATHSNDALLWEQVRSESYWDRHKGTSKNRSSLIG